MEKKEFNLTEFKKKYGFWECEQRSRKIGERDKAIRDRIMKQEQFKMNNIEGHCMDLYGIVTNNITKLLVEYHLTDEYVIDPKSDDYLLPKNNSDAE